MQRSISGHCLLLISICYLAALGCQRAKSPPSAATTKPTVVSTNVPSSQEVKLPGIKAPSPAETVPAAANESPVASTESPPVVQTPPISKERILLLAPGNPIVVEFQLTIDGQPHTTALEKLVDEVLKISDADGDGRTTWKELCACQRVKYGQYGNLAVEGDNGEKQMIDRYDIARDGVVDRSELPRFLTRNAGGSRPFSVRGTLSHRDLNRRASPTWRVIDSDEDGVISAEERAQAASRLAARDNDDDEILLASDLNPRQQTPDMEMMGERRRRGSDAARLLGTHADWGAVQLSLEQEYGGGRPLRAGSFPRTPELFTVLDQNKDGTIRRDEFKGLNDVPPQVVIAAEFGRSHGGEDGGQKTEDRGQESEGQPRLRLISIDPALAGNGDNVALERNRLTISVANTLLTFYVNDTVASGDFSARAKQALEMFDQNKDGYLEASELPESLQGQLGRFEAVDADGDGKAYAHEIEAFLAQQQAGLRAQIHARASDIEDCLFVALDADHDGRLDSRELQAASQRLTSLDTNGDGQLSAHELPEVLTIVLARGSLENADVTFAPPPAIARGTSENSPRWFTAMDANQDGVISRREFLGTAQAFGQLDRDNNGLLDINEAAQATGR